MIELKYGKRKVINYRGAKMVVGGLTAKNKIDILLYINTELANLNSREELFSKVLDLCIEIFEADNVTIRMWLEDRLQPVKYLIETDPPRRPLEEGEGFSGHVFKTRESLYMNDLSKKPEFLDQGEKTRAVICVPVVNGETRFGTLGIEKDVADFYKDDDLEILEAMAAQLAQTLTNTDLIEGMVRAREEQKVVQQQLEWDLKMGRNVQNQIVPEKIEPWNSIQFDCYYEPMVEVSGDYFDIIRKGDALTVIMADVSGHGVPAALVTVALHYHFKLAVEQGLGLLEILEDVSASIRPILPEGVYFTAQLVRIYSDHSYSFVNAGHHPLVHYDYEKGTTTEGDTKGLPIGFVDFNRDGYEEKFGSLKPGDIMMLLTDGFTEQRNTSGEETGIERMIQWLHEEKISAGEGSRYARIEDMFPSVMKKWREFTEGTATDDDLTLLMLQVNPGFREASEFYQKARQANKAQNSSEAFDYSLKAYDSDSSLKDNLLLLSKMYYQNHNYRSGARFLEEYIQVSGDRSTQAYFMLGVMYFKSGEYRKAKRQFKIALSVDHTLGKASLMLARCYLKEREYAKARKVLTKAVKSTPSDEKLVAALDKLEKRMPEQAEVNL